MKTATSSPKVHFSRPTLCGALGLVAAALLVAAGCHKAEPVEPPKDVAGGETSEQYSEQMFDFAIDNLNRLEEFNSPDDFQQLIERLDPRRKMKPGENTLTAVWTEPEMMRQVIDRLNQWTHSQTPPAWQLDPMIAALPKPLASLPQVKDLDAMRFSRFDGHFLQGSVWLRDIAQKARGAVIDDLERAKMLFDWTVRNIQLEPDREDRIPLFPWETLLFGHGTAAERAWVYVLLLRQLDIDAAVLAIDEEQAGKPATKQASTEKPKPRQRLWCVGALVEGNVYLFDPTLGLPIPGPKGVTRDSTGQLVIQPATLAEVAADAKLLRRLDADPSHEYWVKPKQLARVTALLEASPPYPSRRMKLLESKLAGQRKMALTAAPTAAAAHWKKAKHIADARLWLHPYGTLLARSHLDQTAVGAMLQALVPLYLIYQDRAISHDEEGKESGARTTVFAGALGHGRVLQLKGKYVGEDGALRLFQFARPSNESLKLSSADVTEKIVYVWAKQDASYWSGLISYERGNYAAAIDYFAKRTLEAFPGGPWSNGARYNLARAYEASGETERAILQYGINDASPGYLGDLLRAKWLGEIPKP